MLGELEVDGKSANTRCLARAVPRRALDVAERDGLVTRNVAALADGPSVAGTRLDEVRPSTRSLVTTGRSPDFSTKAPRGSPAR